jgi:amino acid adenylation domain-containing protein/thioester reductase-like protein/non-ribosomal peptide synthase protein (TIGR01720 family)
VKPQLVLPTNDSQVPAGLPDWSFNSTSSAHEKSKSKMDEDSAMASQKISKLAPQQPDRGWRRSTRPSINSSKKQTPTTENEKIIERIICDVFGLDDELIGTEDSFFRLGGDSLLAVKISSAARQAGLLLPVAKILSHPRLFEMAKVATRLAGTEDITIDPFSLVNADVSDLTAELTRDWAFTASEIEDVYPCTPLQEGLMVISQSDPRTYTYQNVYKLSPAIDVERFCKAWEDAVKSIVILRTTIVPTQLAGTCQVATTREIEWQFPSDLQKYLKSDLEKGVVYGGPLARYALSKADNGSTDFVWTAHHALYDGWSRPLIWETVKKHYLSGSQKPAGSPAPVPFNRFIHHIQAADQTLVHEFWRTQLSGSTPSRFPHAFHTGYQPQVNETFIHECKVSTGDGTGVTRSTLIRAAWALLMNEYHEGCNDVTYGLTTSGRNADIPEIGDMIAPTITTVPFRVRIDLDEPVEVFLHRLQDQAIEMIPFEQAGLQNISKINSECRLACEFQHVLVIQPEQKNRSEHVFPGITSTQATELHAYALSVQCILGTNKVTVQIEFDNSLIGSFQVQQICSQFETILSQLSLGGSSPIRDVNVFSDLDRKQVLRWNDLAPTLETRTVTALIEAQVCEQPHAPAICSWDGDLTYQQLDRLSNRLAHHLIGLGIGPEIFVPYCFPKSMMTVVAMLAIMKAGGAGVPLDPEYPGERIKGIVGDAGATVVITTPELSARLKSTVSTVISLSDDFLNHITMEGPIVPHRAQPWNALYIPFTSGSTGKPKGIVIEHSMFASSAAAHGEHLGLGPHSRVFQFAAYVFDVNFADIFTSLIRGACICIPSDIERMNDITGAINRTRANSAVLTPTVAAMLTPDQVPTLKTLILGGESLTRDNVRVWANHVDLWNTFGPAECCVYCTAYPLLTPDSDPTVLGYALGSINWVVNPSDHNKLSPVGCIGELVVQGPTVARCYLNDLQKTKAAFVENPAWLPIEPSEQHRIIYKTGDLVKYNADGTLSFIGRKDTQVKVHGQRVELEEIEAHLSYSSDIKHALLTVPSSGRYSGRLVCVMSLNEPIAMGNLEKANEIELTEQKSIAVQVVANTRNYLEEKLPRYMIPAAWVVLKTIPMNASRKLDRKILKNWLETIDEATYRVIADVSSFKATKQPTTHLEKQICNAISKVLALPMDSIGLEHSFLGLGGDSISAMNLMSRLRTQNIRLSVQDILRYRTVEALASHAHLTQEMTNDSLVFEEIHGWFDLTPIQKMFFEKQPNGQNHFNQSFALKLSRKISDNKLETALRTLIDRHPMLRCRYSKSEQDAIWRQKITSEVALSLLLLPSQRLSYDEMAGKFRGIQSQLDIENGPVAAGMTCHANDTQYLFLTVHHLVVDLVSWRVLLEELEELLSHNTLQSETSISYGIWAKLQEQYAQSNLSPEDVLQADALNPEFEYWGMLKQPNIVADAVETAFVLDKERTSLLLGDSQETLGTQPVEVMVAALIHSFCKVFHDRQVPAVFMEGHGRESWNPEIDITRTVGWFTTMYPVSVELERDTDWYETLMKTRDARRRLSHNGWSYFTARHLNPQASKLVETSDMEILFNYLGLYQQFQRPDSLFQPSGIAGQALQDFSPAMERYALFEISAAVENGCLHFTFAVNKHMQHQSSIQHWVTECHRVLSDGIDQLMEQADVPTVGDLSTFSKTPSGIRRLMEDVLPALKISDIEQVESLLQCSPMQLGILLGQLKSPGAYELYTIQEAIGSGDCNADAAKILMAWQEVVDRHAALRTVFIRHSESDNLWGQLVLKHIQPSVCQMINEDPLSALIAANPMRIVEGAAPHHLTLCCGTNGQLFFKLELSHALVDGTSMQIILKDIRAAFGGRLSQASPSLPYGDYVIFLQQQQKRASLQYWKTYLQDIQPCKFPALDDGRPQIHQWKTVKMHVPEVTEAVIRRFSNSYGVTLANVVQGAWAIVLRTFTNADSVAYGYLTSGRDTPMEGIENAVGAFINMLVCRVEFEKSTSGLKTLQIIQDDYLKGIPHQYVSLGEIQHAIGMSGQPLFNTALSFQRRPPPTEPMELSLTSVYEYDPSEFDIAVNVLMNAGQTEIHLTHQTSKISSGNASNIASVLRTTIAALLTRPQTLVSDVNVMSTENKHNLQRWTANIPPTITSCIHNAISKQACNTPDAPALHSWEGDYTYAELESASTRLARQLSRYDIKPDDCIPLCFEKSLYTAIAVLAVLKTGGAFVLLDPKHPPDRLKGLLKDVNAQFLIASETTRKYCETLIENVVVVSPKILGSLPDGDDNFSTAVTPQNIMYVQFTSGSTGKPKGVVIDHSAACSSVYYHGSVMGFGPTTRTFQFSSYGFDAVILEIFTTLYHGGCVCVPSDDDRMSHMTHSIRKMNVNMMFMTPTLAQLFKPEDVPSLKTLMVGGELIDAGTTDTWSKNVNLFGVYGPCECTVYSTYNPLSSNDFRPEVIGYPLGSVIWLVDPNNHNRLVPVGAVGELIVQGPIVGRGYLNDPQRTEASFLSNTTWLSEYSGSQQHRLYKTGDLARHNSDGTLTILGRKDTQFKLNGQRIDFAEIEHAMKQFSQVLQVAADVTYIGGRPLLSVFVNLEAVNKEVQGTTSDLLPMTDSYQATLIAIESALAKTMPPYMIPRLWFPISQMPLSASGKTERKVLRSWGSSLSEAQVNQYALGTGSKKEPSTEVERKLAKLWQRVLNVSSVGREDSFFRLGGDSISAMQLVSAAHRAGIKLSVADVFENPILLDMATKLPISQMKDKLPENESMAPFSLCNPGMNQSQFIRSAAEKAKIHSDWVEDIFPCTPLQEGMMALTTRDAGSYGWQDVLKIPATIDLDRFRSAWQAVVYELGIMRTRLVQMDQHGTWQVVIKPEHSTIVWNYGESLEDYLSEDKNLPFGYGTPLYRFGIVHQGTKTYSVSSAHHTILDRWSISLMMDRLSSHYLSQNPPPTPPFNRFIKWMRSLDPEVSNQYWKLRFKGSSALEFPRSIPGHRSRATAVAKHSITTSPNGTANITVSTLLRAAWAITISQHTGSEDVVFGMTQTGRNAPVPDITEIVAPLITVVPFHATVGKHMTVAELLQKINQHAIAMIPYEHAGLQHIAQLNEECQAASKFQNLLVIQSQQHQQQGKLPLGLERLDVVENDVLSYGIVLVCDLTEDAVMLQAAFDPKVVSPTMMDTLLAQFGHFFQQLNEPQISLMRLEEIQLVGDHDFRQLVAWNQPCSAERVDKCAHELIHERALVQPKSIAIESGEGQLTYAQLDELSTKLAEYLRLCHQVGPEKIVPLFFRKSPWAVVSMLAVAKAGGAFVFLDPAHPMDRLMFIARQIKATFIITTPDLSSTWESTALTPLEVTEDIMGALPIRQQLPVSGVKPHDVLYVIFTSGSTGTPKGCVVEHTSFLSGAIQHARQSRLTSTTRVLQYAPSTFDVSILETLTGLLSGACICLPKAEHQNTPVSQVINDLQITWSFLTPSVARTISPKDCPSLKTLILGGESLSRVDIETWAGKVHLCNGYGPSECSVACTANVSITVDTDPANIGSTMCCNAWVVDSNNSNSLLPIGAVGELLIAGPVVCRGYLNEPEKTKAVFIDPPTWLNRFGSSLTPENRLYLTGDLVRYNDDGTLHFIGRKDTQVKLRGQRIELGEIETHTSAHPSVRHAAVELPRSGRYRDSLVAILSLREIVPTSYDLSTDELVPVSGKQLDVVRQSIPDIRSCLSQQLPPYMVPSSFIVLDNIPLLSSGKINRSKIRLWLENMSIDMHEQIAAQVDMPATHTAPLIPNEQITALILSKRITQLLAKGDEEYTIAIRDRDIALAPSGLNSISAVSLAAYIKKQFDVRISIDSLLEVSMTVSGVACMIDSSKDDPAATKTSSSTLNLSLKVERALAELHQKAASTQLQVPQSAKAHHPETVLLTGATGFLGSQILKDLLELPQIKRVVTLVRALNQNKATARVIESAQKSKWWRDRYSSKLEVWVGDLSQPDLGLNAAQWRCIEGQSDSPASIDAIIHNGAAVHWGYDYHGLEAVNVTSTVSLLASLIRSPTPPRFTFISGGQLFFGNDENHDEVEAFAQMMKTAGGYAQTKYVSDQVVKEFSRRYNTSIATIVKPGLIVGTADSGISNTDDFLWRVVASVVEIGAFNSAGLDGLILVSGSHQVASTILADVLNPRPHGHDVETTIRYGISVGKLWDMLRDDFGYQLEAVDSTEWLARLRMQVEARGEEHRLWPVFHLLEATGGRLGIPMPAHLRQDEHNHEVEASLRKSIDYLREVGFLPSTNTAGSESILQKDLVFARARGRTRT